MDEIVIVFYSNQLNLADLLINLIKNVTTKELAQRYF